MNKNSNKNQFHLRYKIVKKKTILIHICGNNSNLLFKNSHKNCIANYQRYHKKNYQKFLFGKINNHNNQYQ